MQSTSTISIGPKNGHWAPTPKYLLRKSCVEHQIRNWKPDSFVEFGSGTGHFIKLFLHRGFHGACYDISEKNREIIASNLSSFMNVQVVDDLNVIHGKKFQYIIATEVIEHIENDQETLCFWTTFLNHHGKILLTVPAHQKKFGLDDLQVGHLRRYEKKQLYDLLKECGFGNIIILNYGFPLGNITRLLHNRLLKNQSRDDFPLDAVERSMFSGRNRPSNILKYSFLFKKPLLWPFFLLQRLTWYFDWGDGYVVTAEKIGHGQT